MDFGKPLRKRKSWDILLFRNLVAETYDWQAVFFLIISKRAIVNQIKASSNIS